MLSLECSEPFMSSAHTRRKCGPVLRAAQNSSGKVFAMTWQQQKGSDMPGQRRRQKGAVALILKIVDWQEIKR